VVEDTVAEGEIDLGARSVLVEEREQRSPLRVARERARRARERAGRDVDPDELAKSSARAGETPSSRRQRARCSTLPRAK